MKFDKVFKLYIFKKDDVAKLSLKVNENLVVEYKMKINEIKHIVDNWKTGVDFSTDNNNWFIEYKSYGPRPESVYSPYVRFSVSQDRFKFHYRLTYNDMLDLERDFYYQINNKMYWEENV